MPFSSERAERLKELLESGEKFDEVIAIGPLPMMKFVCKLTKEYDIPTTVSMNPVMIDGTGMCGGCRVIVGGETKFACVDGPDFDGHLVDWDEAIARSRMFRPEEQKAREKLHKCRLTGEVSRRVTKADESLDSAACTPGELDSSRANGEVCSHG